MIASVRAAVGDLDRVDAWVTVSGFVQAEPGYATTTAIIVFGGEIGQHARTAIGVAAELRRHGRRAKKK